MEGIGHNSNWKRDFHHRNNSWDATHSSSSSSSSSSLINKNERLPHSFGPQRDFKKSKLTRETYREIHERVLQHFGKKFSFDPSLHTWQLPEPDEMFTTDDWQEDRLQHMKEALNAVKSKLNDYNLGEWHKHTRAMNMAAYILKAVKNRCQAEFVTQAWCKFYEIVATYDLVPESANTDGRFNSLHLCEAPGAFIAALNHYLKLNKDLNWKWLSTTLNPYYEGNPLSCMINDDRFILHTLENWTFGADFTGNLMDTSNFKHILEESQKMGDVLLVTADGSIDCQENPGEQEHIVSALHYCETVTALHALAAGGSFLLKIFTIYEHVTICLLYLLCCAFKHVNIYKPATSKEGNSEVYVVCLEYIGSELMEPWLKILRQHYGEEKQEKAMFPRQLIPDSFIQRVFECAEKFKNLQVAVIERNIAVFEGIDQPFEFNWKLRDMVTEHYIEHCKLTKLNDDDYIVGKHKLMETVALNVGPKNEEGSFNDRCKKRKLDPSEQLSVLQDEVTNLEIKWPFEDEDIKWLTFKPKLLKKFSIRIGKPIHTVESSKFCMGPLLGMHNQALNIAFEKFGYSMEGKKNGGQVRSELLSKYRELPKKYNKIINFGQRLWIAMARGENTEANIDALYEIADTVEELWRGDTLLLQGYPMLTQLNVGVVYLLSRIFDMVGFIKPHKQDCAVIFCGYRSGSHTLVSCIEDIANEMGRLDKEGLKQAVLALVPISVLCGYEQEEIDETQPGSDARQEDQSEERKNVDIDFHRCVTHINNLCVKERIIHVVNAVLC
ncbi:cap-specific mRNA (nucleoside-2'-O-)-methyltransferase 2 isoform X3 [Schistocerca cancellata]|nr:cap-specific mRNA (nucleoside-2'-O-)-methyltransferase 2 isoform X3 [Schistocerca cancellata]XP_049787048.1 cap-specific mRNA (nucleoside-2'-O-)-methyltransferase 2 isoform X3 [Schistocerca cancellata]